MSGWAVAAAVWVIGFARTACLIGRPTGLRLTSAIFWPVVSLPCLFHLPASLRRWSKVPLAVAIALCVMIPAARAADLSVLRIRKLNADGTRSVGLAIWGVTPDVDGVMVIPWPDPHPGNSTSIAVTNPQSLDAPMWVEMFVYYPAIPTDGSAYNKPSSLVQARLHYTDHHVSAFIAEPPLYCKTMVFDSGWFDLTTGQMCGGPLPRVATCLFQPIPSTGFGGCPQMMWPVLP
jgi:hypothetical protein